MPELVLLPQLSGNGYYSYGRREHQYGTQPTVDTIVQIAKDWFRNQRYEIGIGDLSLQQGGDTPDHQSHERGTHVDLRPLRKDKKPEPTNINAADYDREATRLLVESLRAHRNVKRILFNDAAIAGVVAHAGHDNHLHVEMKA